MNAHRFAAQSINADAEQLAFGAGLDDGGRFDGGQFVDWKYVANLLQLRRDPSAAAAYGRGWGLGAFLRWAVSP